MAERGELEQAFAVLDTYQRQIEALSRQLNFLQALHEETVQAREALAGLRGESREEILVPLGANTYIHARAADRERAIAGIGAGYSMERPWADAEARLSEREGQIRAEMGQLSEAIVRLQQEAATLDEQIQQDLAPAAAEGDRRAPGR